MLADTTRPASVSNVTVGPCEDRRALGAPLIRSINMVCPKGEVIEASSPAWSNFHISPVGHTSSFEPPIPDRTETAPATSQPSLTSGCHIGASPAGASIVTPESPEVAVVSNTVDQPTPNHPEAVRSER